MVDVVDRLRRAPEVLCEYEVKQLLAGVGVRTTDETLAGTAPEAVAAARAIGFPVALKVQSPDLPHKQAAGGVLLGLASPAEVEKGFAEITARVERDHPAAAVHGLLVQEMVPEGLELIVGIDNTSGLGPMVLLGFGGAWPRSSAARVMYPAPFGVLTATAMLADIGRRPGPAVARRGRRHHGGGGGAARQVAGLAGDGAGAIREMDLNPSSWIRQRASLCRRCPHRHRGSINAGTGLTPPGG